MDKWLAGPPRLRVLFVPVTTTITVSISCAVCVILPVSVSISLVVSVSLPSPFLVSTAFASTIVVLPACVASRGGDLAIGRDNLARWDPPLRRSCQMHARHEEHAGNASKCPYAHRLRKAPIRGDIRYRRAAGGQTRPSVLAFVCAGGCRSCCACFWIQPC